MIIRKKCIECQKWPLTEFFNTSNENADGYEYTCNPCIEKAEELREELNENKLKNEKMNKKNEESKQTPKKETLKAKRARLKAEEAAKFQEQQSTDTSSEASTEEVEVPTKVVEKEKVTPTKRHKNTRLIEQVDPETDEAIAEFESARAAGDAIEKDPARIRTILRGSGRTAFGFGWRYKQEK